MYKQIVAERRIFPLNLAKSGGFTNPAPAFFYNCISDENDDLRFVKYLFSIAGEVGFRTTSQFNF